MKWLWALLAVVLLLPAPSLAYDYTIIVQGSEVVSPAQVKHIIEVTEILCGKKLDGPLQVVFLPFMYMMDLETGTKEEICGCTDAEPPYAILISSSRYPIYQWGLLAHEIAHNIRPEWSENQILCIEYAFRHCYGRP